MPSSQTILTRSARSIPPLLLRRRAARPSPPISSAFSRPSSSSSNPNPNPSSTSTSTSTSTFQPGPSPPRLPPKEQAEFERLQRTANTQEGFNPSATDPSLLSSASAATTTTSGTGTGRAQDPSPRDDNDNDAAIGIGMGTGTGTMSTPLRRGAPPEFDGDVNPRTGEVGGPKNEPLRWGAQGDYSFNGRVTDF
ncbi:DUF1674-domain-containing protein [Biscogniauxia mediterranea]|nr:DUF1674-domain-containing protein [Biscogniauxia mediterranea]